MRLAPSRGRGASFTLVELLITTAIIGILTTMIVAATYRSMAFHQAQLCMANQRQIGLALHLYYNKHHILPPDVGTTLRRALARILPDPHVFKCPADKEPNWRDSYAPYYVRRTDVEKGEVYVLGCPRHRSGVRTFQNSRATMSALAPVTADGRVIDQAASIIERTITDGTLAFDDGSRATIRSAEGGYGITVVQSFRLSDGSLYTVIRVWGNGNLDISVTPGARFEVLTPSALIGVQGTRFRVATADRGGRTRVDVLQGAVVVQGRKPGSSRTQLGDLRLNTDDGGENHEVKYSVTVVGDPGPYAPVTESALPY
jgi:hypothetical protein